MKRPRSGAAHLVPLPLLLVLMLLVAAAPAHADPPVGPDHVVDAIDDVDCGGVVIELRQEGWWHLLGNGDDNVFTRYHITRTYTAPDGGSWKYQDTGIVRTSGDSRWLAGHSVNVGPEGTGWFGRWYRDANGVESRFGHGPGDVDDRACEALLG